MSRSIAAAVDADVSKQLASERASWDASSDKSSTTNLPFDALLSPQASINENATSPSTLSSTIASSATTFTAVAMPPYFKGQKSHYEKKYEKALAKKRASTRSPEKAHQRNTDWRNILDNTHDNQSDLVALLKFLCAKERLHKSDFASHYKNSKEMWDRINNSKKPWEEYFGNAKDDIDVEEELAPIIGCAGDDDDGLIFGDAENDENGDEFQTDEA